MLPADYTIRRQPGSFSDPSRGILSCHALFSQPSTPTSAFCSGIAILPPRERQLCAHRHGQTEMYHILAHRGTVTIDGKETEVEKDCAVFIPGNSEHRIRNMGDEELKWLYIFPTGNFGDVIYRFSGQGETGIWRESDNKL